jgi:hypothetical protein
MYTQHHVPRFIDDLVYLILESNDHWWPRDLLRLATVSPAWLDPVRKRLYACPSIRSFRACGLLARTLRENPCLLSLLHGIDIRPSIGFDVNDRELTAKEMASLRYILSLDGLESLTLGGELAVQAERFLHALVHPDAITELYIDGSHAAGHSYLRCRKAASLEWDEVMAFKFPNLQKLKLCNLELDILHPPMPYDLQIADLELNDVDITSGHLPHLFYKSWSSLRRLSVIATRASEFDEQMRLTLDVCGPGLETLYYEVVDARSDYILFDDDTTPLPSLRYLGLNGVEVHSHTLPIIHRLCQNLEYLSITGRVVWINPADWVSFLVSGALPSLHILSTPWGTYRPPFAHWSQEMRQSVRDASANRKIQLCPLATTSRS